MLLVQVPLSSVFFFVWKLLAIQAPRCIFFFLYYAAFSLLTWLLGFGHLYECLYVFGLLPLPSSGEYILLFIKRTNLLAILDTSLPLQCMKTVQFLRDPNPMLRMFKTRPWNLLFFFFLFFSCFVVERKFTLRAITHTL